MCRGVAGGVATFLLSPRSFKGFLAKKPQSFSISNFNDEVFWVLVNNCVFSVFLLLNLIADFFLFYASFLFSFAIASSFMRGLLSPCR